MASFPGSIKTFTDQVDDIDTVDAADINAAYDEIEAIETELGTDPAGSYTDVSDRLDAIEAGATISGNLIKNYPSLEGADGLAPEWWTSFSCTLTEEDATGESISNPKNERLLKGVTTAAGGYIYQQFTPAYERLLVASNTVVSVGVWVYVVTSGTVTLELADSSTGAISSDTTTTTGSWVYLEVVNQTIGANDLQVRLKHSADSATFYVANPVLNTGPAVGGFKPRGVVRREAKSNFYSDDPGGSAAGWQDRDVSSITSENAVYVQLMVGYYNTTSANNYIRVRRKGDTGDTIAHEVIRNRDTTGYRHINSFTVMLNDQGNFQYSSGANSGDNEQLSISLVDYWEWE